MAPRISTSNASILAVQYVVILDEQIDVCIRVLVKYGEIRGGPRRYSNIPAATNLALALAVFRTMMLNCCRCNCHTAAKMVRRRVVQQSLEARGHRLASAAPGCARIPAVDNAGKVEATFAFSTKGPSQAVPAARKCEIGCAIV